ncbi:hypothetical protein D499_0X00100 [Hanseniaspora uvarum DSM 2768]|nr:hypothetical protein D499_0X00100 [Hanseniaspora uvarum DSM 2768]
MLALLHSVNLQIIIIWVVVYLANNKTMLTIPIILHSVNLPPQTPLLGYLVNSKTPVTLRLVKTVLNKVLDCLVSKTISHNKVGCSVPSQLLQVVVYLVNKVLNQAVDYLVKTITISNKGVCLVNNKITISNKEVCLDKITLNNKVLVYLVSKQSTTTRRVVWCQASCSKWWSIWSTSKALNQAVDYLVKTIPNLNKVVYSGKIIPSNKVVYLANKALNQAVAYLVNKITISNKGVCLVNNKITISNKEVCLDKITLNNKVLVYLVSKTINHNKEGCLVPSQLLQVVVYLVNNKILNHNKEGCLVPNLLLQVVVYLVTTALQNSTPQVLDLVWSTKQSTSTRWVVRSAKYPTT